MPMDNKVFFFGLYNVNNLKPNVNCKCFWNTFCCAVYLLCFPQKYPTISPNGINWLFILMVKHYIPCDVRMTVITGLSNTWEETASEEADSGNAAWEGFLAPIPLVS